MIARGIHTALISYMQDRANQVVTIDQLVFHFQDRFDRKQIMGNVANLMKTPAGANIERLQTGMWRYNTTTNGKSVAANKNGSKQSFETIHEANGGLLLLGEDNELYWAKKLNI